ncbi:MAG: hypothetical protein Q9162_000249 [Coniocarpon cinnabarinum]
MAEYLLPTAVATATGLYFNSRWQLSHDLNFLREFIRIQRYERRITTAGRINTFYLFEERLLADLDHDFLVYEGQKWSYKQAYDTILQHARWLQERGVRSGQIVALIFTNKPEFIWLWLAMWSLNVKPAFINCNLTGRPLVHSVKTSTAQLMLLDEEIQDLATDEVRKELADVDIEVFTSEAERGILELEPFRADDSVRAGAAAVDMAMIIYTSGTTGLPKPAHVSWRRVGVAAVFSANFLGMKPSDVLHTPMPLYHSAASILGLSTTLAAGATLSLSHRFSPRTFWQEVTAHNATIIQYVGETLRYLLAVPSSPLEKQHRVRIAFGNGLRPDVWNKAKDRFNIPTIAEFYAATEGIGGSWNISRGDFTAGAIGRVGSLLRVLFRGNTEMIELDIATEEPVRDPATGLCKIAPTGTPGEMVAKLDEQNLKESFLGYFQNEAATNKKILRNVRKKGDAYFRSGDLLRANDDGLRYFVDRIGDTFRWKSENVATSEVAEVLGMHPHIVEANVYGVSIPNHDGRAGCAALVLDGQANREPDAQLLTGLATHVQRNLASYARPLFLRFVEALEQTGTGKTMKHALREEGVEPARLEQRGKRDRLYWLRGERYVPFRQKDWEEIKGGRVRL